MSSIRLLAVLALVVIMSPPFSSQNNTEPIDKRGLLEALKNEVLSSDELIGQIKKRKVTFRLTPNTVREIRATGAYLGKRGLNDLIAALGRNQHRPPTTKKAAAGSQKAPPAPSSAITQTMTNSPGGIQAGGNVTVNQGLEQRQLTPEQEIQFVGILRNNPKGRVEISCIESGGPEPCNFGRQLARLLESKEAGWTVDFSPLMFGAGDPTKIIPEIYILVQKGNVPERAGVLQHALRTVGLDAVGIEREDVAADYVQLTIWFKRS